MIIIDQYRAAIGRWHIFCSYRPRRIKTKSNCKLGTSLATLCRKVRPCLILVILLLALLILQSGYIELNPGPTGLLVCHINVRSLCPTRRTKRIDEIHSHLVIDKGYDLICVSETWLNKDIDDAAVALKDFQIFRKDRAQGGGGGVAVYARESIPIKRRFDLEWNNLEIVVVEVVSEGKKFIIGCCYRPPGANA